MDETQSWSLWLVPEGELYQSLSNTIDQLADEYQAPRFEPHVTLLGVLAGPEGELRKQAARLAAVMQRCRIRLSSPDYTEAYFQCLFLRVEPTAGLMEANRQAKGIFSTGSESEYMPHISLLYGRYPEKTKRDIITGLGEELAGEFTAAQFHLYNTSGQPAAWQRVKTFSVR